MVITSVMPPSPAAEYLTSSFGHSKCAPNYVRKRSNLPRHREQSFGLSNGIVIRCLSNHPIHWSGKVEFQSSSEGDDLESLLVPLCHDQKMFTNLFIL